MSRTTGHSEQARRVHVEGDDAGRVLLAVDHADALDRELARIVEGDDAAAVAAMSPDDAERLAAALLDAAAGVRSRHVEGTPTY